MATDMTLFGALQQLDACERLVLSLVHEHTLTIDEASRVLELDPRDVRKLYRGAWAHLREVVPAVALFAQFPPHTTQHLLVH